MSKKILVITGDFAEDYEVMVPVQVLQICNYEVDVVCPDKKAEQTIQTAVHDFKPEYQFFVETHGHCFKLNKSFDEVKVEEYAGLYLPGGRAPEYLRYNKKVMEMVEYFLKNKNLFTKYFIYKNNVQKNLSHNWRLFRRLRSNGSSSSPSNM